MNKRHIFVGWVFAACYDRFFTIIMNNKKTNSVDDDDINYSCMPMKHSLKEARYADRIPVQTFVKNVTLEITSSYRVLLCQFIPQSVVHG